MENRIKAIKEYLKYFPNDTYANNNLTLCEYAEELGIELKNRYYPRVDYGYFIINSQIKAGKKYCLTNTATNYIQNGKDTIIIWHEPCGRLEFVSTEYWWDIDEEWTEFMGILKSYNPVDYDDINATYIYDMENGKKLIADYDEIMKSFLDKVKKKIQKVNIEKKKAELERLQRELEGAE